MRAVPSGQMVCTVNVGVTQQRRDTKSQLFILESVLHHLDFKSFSEFHRRTQWMHTGILSNTQALPLGNQTTFHIFVL